MENGLVCSHQCGIPHMSWSFICSISMMKTSSVISKALVVAFYATSPPRRLWKAEFLCFSHVSSDCSSHKLLLLSSANPHLSSYSEAAQLTQQIVSSLLAARTEHAQVLLPQDYKSAAITIRNYVGLFSL